jgi:hypothetical protein
LGEIFLGIIFIYHSREGGNPSPGCLPEFIPAPERAGMMAEYFVLKKVTIQTLRVCSGAI